ncbi:two-component system, NtrC family, response regulator/two-component system, NtrC family, nitrogen regulation response regulator GlnG/two-component system, NtrC family, response regulator AtoC [Verrucomicrobium sp. GAS474]|uniref:sigma-54-dependent transcriptional regulator n=1 Tax=Verrucomicrobium sp. GAS474 TaxID=1882831 RepID=UPI000879E0C6|nr:sigma-54 dependent transcriptional regulator [Verrucomicrobium sp. GAS474]SDT95526.1 two-component system, NtrC family, response regulator/two-component system, NtrC family, nitrogen regulation response regulator GlnG/two-component system, NtrC family, response regulator AtoC [Verrucomicrobium sp. GAS474]
MQRTSSAGSILLVEDEPDFAASVTRVLVAAGYEVRVVSSVAEAQSTLRRRDPDVILSDVHLPDGNGLDLLKAVRARDPLRPILLMTASGSVDLAVEATVHGAFDYLLKPVERTQLLEAVGKAMASRAMSKEAVALPTEKIRKDDSPIVGSSPAMLRLFKEVGRVARQPVPVLLLGETGTGKELIARALYRYSGLKNQPFVPINCAAIPETLIESELFGHEKGAFTGAQARRIGRFQQASGGMLFLDEIGELPLPMQAKLLRVLQEKEIQPLGGNAAVKINVRIVAATHRNLEEEVAAGRFREDLYFRINIAPLYLPPLRERREDIPELVAFFLRRQAEEAGQPVHRVAPEALAWLRDRPWPGNVRELENTVKRAALFVHGGVLGVDALLDAVRRNARPSDEERGAGRIAPFPQFPVSEALDVAALPLAATEPQERGGLDALVEHLLDRHLKPKRAGASAPPAPLLAQVEREVILRVLKRVKNNKTRAAEILGINRKTLREKLTLHHIAEETDETTEAAERT